MAAKVIMSRVLRHGRKDDGAFDREFWQTIGAEGIFAAAWEMVLQANAIRGLNDSEQRLQRSVCSIQRRKR